MMNKNELFLVFADPQGNNVAMYTFHKLDRKFELDNPSTITYNTNKNEEIVFFKYFIKTSLAQVTKITKDEKIKKINILCFGDVYQRLAGSESEKYIEPSISNKVNIFNLFLFMPFTTITIENFFIQLSENFCEYRLKYLYSNVPLINLIELNNLLSKIYKQKKISSKENFNFTDNKLMFLNYMNFYKLFEDDDLYIPKLYNMNKFEFKYNINYEDIVLESLEYQKLMFFLNTYSGVIKIEHFDLNTNIEDINKISNLTTINKFLTLQNHNFISFDFLKEIMLKYPKHIKNIKIEEIFFSSVINLKKMLVKNDDFYNFNFVIEVLKNDIYRYILTQKIILKHIDFLTIENKVDNFGIFIEQCLCYFNKKEKISNNDFYIYSVDNKESETEEDF